MLTLISVPKSCEVKDEALHVIPSAIACEREDWQMYITAFADSFKKARGITYTLPSKAFPKLCVEGKHYTEEQIKYLREYAAARGVVLIPEFECPGHVPC